MSDPVLNQPLDEVMTQEQPVGIPAPSDNVLSHQSVESIPSFSRGFEPSNRDTIRESLLVPNVFGFENKPGLQKTAPISFVDATKAAFFQQIPGTVGNAIYSQFQGSEAVEGYDPIQNVPDQYLNDYWYFADSTNPAQTQEKIRRYELEQWSRSTLEQASILTNIGANLTAALVDPTTWIMPAGKIFQVSQKAFLAGKTMMATKAIAQSAYTVGKAGFQQAVLTEAAIQSTQQLKSLEESAFDVLATTVFTGLIGGAAGGINFGRTYANAKKEFINVMAGNEDVPGYKPNNPNDIFAPGGEMHVQPMPGTETIVGIPKWLRKATKLSPQNRLIDSPSLTANGFANDAYNHPFTAKKNIGLNQPTQANYEAQIESIIKRGNAVMTREIDSIFYEQQGINPDGLFTGVKSRIANGKVGANREQFFSEIYLVMDSGIPSQYEWANKSAKIIRENILNPIKQELVDLGYLHKDFLLPEHDNYFTRLWHRNEIIRRPDDFRTLVRAWFFESNNWLKANKEKLDLLSKPLELAQRNLATIQRNISRVISSKSYKSELAINTKILNELKDKVLIEKAQIRKLREEIKTIKKEGKGLKGTDKANATKSINAKLKQIESRKTKAQELRNEQKKVRQNKNQKLKSYKEKLAKYEEQVNTRQEALYKFIPKQFRTPDGAIPRIKDDLELVAGVDQTIDNILGTSIERYMNPLSAGKAAGLADPLQARVFTIPNEFTTRASNGNILAVRDFVSKDVGQMVNNYLRQTAATVVLGRNARQKGFKDIPSLKRAYLEGIKKEFRGFRKGLEGKKSSDMKAKEDEALTAVNDTFDLLYDIAGKQVSPFNSSTAKTMRRLGTYTTIRLLGSSMLSSITDIVMPIFRQGPFHFAQEYLPPLFAKIAGSEAIAKNIDALKDMGYALNTMMGQRAKAFIDNDDLLIRHNIWGKITEPVVNTFGNLTLNNQATDIYEGIAGHVSISRTLRAIVKKVETGTISERERIRLRHLTIGEEQERIIYDLWKKGGGGKESGAYYSNHPNWKINNAEELAAYRAFNESIIKDMQSSTLKANKGDKPIFAYSDWGSFILKFKDYLFAANNKLVLAAAQKISQREFDVFVSMGLMMAMGDLSYICTSLAKGDKPDLSNERMLHEAVDRSALLGIFMEPINIFQKAGWLPGEVVSRYKSRGLAGSFVGPGFGIVEDTVYAVGDIFQNLYGNKEYTTKEAQRILKLLPLQNLFYMRYINEQLFKKAAAGLGAEERE